MSREFIAVLTNHVYMFTVFRNILRTLRLPLPQSKLSAYDAGITVSPVCVTYCPPLAILVNLYTPTLA